MLAVQSCPTLWDLMDYSLPDSSVHGILQARILEWIVMPFSPGNLPELGIKPRSPALQADSLPFEPPGKPPEVGTILIILQMKKRRHRGSLTSHRLSLGDRIMETAVYSIPPQNQHQQQSGWKHQACSSPLPTTLAKCFALPELQH